MNLDDRIAAADHGTDGQADDIPQRMQAPMFATGIGKVLKTLPQGKLGGLAGGHSSLLHDTTQIRDNYPCELLSRQVCQAIIPPKAPASGAIPLAAYPGWLASWRWRS